MAATTQLHIVKYANDKATILNETTKTYQWLEGNLPVLGDETTHYYSQGPTNNDSDLWDDAEWQNIDTRDWGAVKGTDLKNICNLVGGMSAGETVKIKASDGFSKTFPYEYVYTPNSRQGPMGITWYRADQGYVTNYIDGMRLVMFADAKTNTFGWNTSGWHVFGNADMRDSWAPNYWYNYSSTWPSSGGVSVKWVSEIIIYSNEAPPVKPSAAFSSDIQSGIAPLLVKFTDQSTGTEPLAYAWDFDNNGTIDSTVQNPSYTYPKAGTYTVNLTVKNIAGNDTELKTNYITVNPAPIDEWSITLNGVGTEQLSRVNFESLGSGNRLTITDASGTWSGIALWRLLSRVDDTDPTTFSDTVADLGYNVTVTASDGFSKVFNSSYLKRNDNVIVADSLNGAPLPKLDGTKKVWPLKIVGTVPTTGHKVGNITQIILSDFVAPPAAPIAGFTAVPLSGPAPLEVQFTDQSTGTSPLSYAWDFNNDGSVDSTLQNPKITLTNEGTYDVNLTVTNAVSSDSELKTNYITVTAAPVAPTAAFFSDIQSGDAPLTVKFTDQSTGTGPLTYAWDFDNNGITDNTTRSPSYTFDAAGTYTVNLTVSNNVGSDSEVRISYISVTSAPVMDTIYDGTVTLTPGETFTKNAYNNITNVYTINRTTPLGALDKVALQQGFTYNVTDKRWQYDQVLLLDDVSHYLRKSPGYWYAYVNGAYKDGYGNHANGLNVIELANNDQVNFYYSTGTNLTAPTDALAAVKIKVNIQPPGPVVDTIYDGTVTLTPGETFTKQAYNNVTGGLYTINRTTPLGALDKVATLQGFTYNVTDKRWEYDQALLLDDIGQYLNKKPNIWYAYVNGVFKDGYGNHANGLNVIELSNNDQVNFYYAPNKDPNPIVNATAVVKIKANIPAPGPVVDTLFDGTVTLTPGETFTKQAYNNVTGGLYTINRTTPLGALDKVATLQGFTYNVTDKRWEYDQALLLDDIGQYLNKKPNIWYAYVNGVFKDGYGNHANGLNVIELSNNDQVNFYYAPNKDPNPIVNATAVVKIKVNIGGSQPVDDWTLSLNGAKTTSVTKTYFEQGLACPTSGHQVFWTDPEGNVWGGVPLWVLVAMVDDNPDAGPDHFNFNDSIATQGYSVKVISGDGWDTTLSSQNIARNNSILVVNTLNGTPLPLLTPAGKRSWPLHLKGEAVFGGQQVGNITKIELTGLPQPPTEWKITLEGDVTDTITQSFFIDAIACKHNVTWTDPVSGTVWQGVPLWDLAGAVDDVESSNHYTYNDTRATMGYIVRVSAADGFNATFASADTTHNDGYIVAYKMNGTALTGSNAPLKLVGPATSSNKQRVGGIAKISLEGLPDQYPAGNWQLKMVGKISDIIPQGEFEYSADCHNASYTDINGNVYTGIPLWRLMGWVDDRIPHGSDGFNDPAAIAGYKVIVKAGDGYAKEFTSQQVGKTNAFIVANTYNGGPIPNDGDHPPYPLRLVGTGATGGNSVGNVVEIQLTDFQTPTEAPKLHIIKYAGDGVTVINETYVDYIFLESNLPVIGDGTTAYKFEGLTLDPTNLWDPQETYPGGFKISNVVKGSRVHDLAELVGGMGSGTTITFVASDGFETTLPYSSIYTNPAVQARQGDAIIAWWGDGQYVPKYADGMRLFFTPDGDHVYGHWDMHETLPSQYWRYNFQDGIQYPSSAGLSAKYITTIKVYSTPESDWTLELDGREIGGVNYTVSKPFLEEALGCQFGADHKATYTDGKDRAWEGMPLWFFVGFVDDADQHSANAYNVTKAQAGYNIIITGKDGYNTTVFSKDIIRSSNYLVANSLNGTHIAESDENWPLRFTGVSVNGSMTVKSVRSIKLIRTVVPPAEGQLKITSTPAGAEIFINGIDTNNVTPYTFTKAPGDYPVYVILSGCVTPAPATATVVSSQLTTKDFVLDAVPPADGRLEVTSTPAGAKIFINGIDTNNVTPYTFTKSPGDYPVYVTLSGYVTPATQTKVVTENAVTPFDFQLNPITTSSLTVTSPNGGESWKRGSTHTVTWDYTGSPGSTVKIMLYKAGAYVGTITDSAPVGSSGKGSYSWPISTTGSTGNDFKVGIQSISQPAIKDLSNNNFVITPAGTTTPSITLTSPIGGESWKRGSTHTVTWDYTGSPGSTVKIMLYKAGVYVGTITDSAPIGSSGKGSYTWPISATGSTGSDFKVGIQSISQPTIKDVSDNYFTVTSGTTSPASITVTSPNGGENWQRSTSHAITWSYTGSPGSTVKIVLLKGGVEAGTIASSVPIGSGGKGSYTWPISSAGYTGSDFKVSIQSISQPIIKDVSNNYFTLSSGTSTKKPVASFNQDKYSGNVPLTVRFTDISKNNPTSYLWSFGDGSTSTVKNPSHTYTKVGVYIIHLTATNSAGSDTSRSVVAVLPKWWHR